MYRLKDYQGKTAEFGSILEYLSSRRVFEIDRNDDGTFEVSEKCDDYFGVDLTAEQLIALADEIRAMAT